MNLNSAALKLMAAKGLTLEDVADIVAANEKGSDSTNAVRQARYRAKRKEGTSNAVTVTPVTPSPNEEDNLTPTRKIPPKANALDPTPKKHRLPVDWQPKPFTPGSLAAQTVARWEPGRMERELAKFRDHHTAAGTKWENWQAAWSKWVNNSDDFQGGRSGQQHHSNHGGKSAAAYAMLNASPDEPF